MEKEYMISFSSFYKAAYAQDVLAEAGIRGTLRKLPTELMRSCSTGLYLRNSAIGEVKDALAQRQISTSGIYEIVREERGKRKYLKIK